MFGNNEIMSPLKSDGSILHIYEIFRTIQGEGPYAGRAAVFIRLSGCNLACSFCDTDFDDYTQMSIADIIEQIKILSQGENLVVITGGEPFRQNIKKLTDQLISKQFIVQIETNGTLYQELDKRVDIICSPKNNSGSYAKIRADLLQDITAIKFIISASNNNYNDIADVGQNTYDIPVYVQPMDEYDADKNRANLNLAKDITLKNNYILSVQLQKIMGIK